MPTPTCKCRVRYIGSSVPTQTKDGLQALQQPLSERYPELGVAEARGIDAWLSVWSNGLLLEYVQGEREKKSTRQFFPITTLHYCAAVRFVMISNYEGTGASVKKFMPLDSPFADISKDEHPPIFAAIMRRTTGVKVLECHAFICRHTTAANALVRCCFHSYAGSKFMGGTGDPIGYPSNVEPPIYIERGGSMYNFPVHDNQSFGGRLSLRSLPVSNRPHTRHIFGEPLYATPMTRSMHNISEDGFEFQRMPPPQYPPPLPPPPEGYFMPPPEIIQENPYHHIDYMRDRQMLHASSERLIWPHSPMPVEGYLERPPPTDSLSAHSDPDSSRAERIVHGGDDVQHPRQLDPNKSSSDASPQPERKSKKHKKNKKHKHHRKEKRSHEEPTYLPSARPYGQLATFDPEHPERFTGYFEQQEAQRHKHHKHKHKSKDKEKKHKKEKKKKHKKKDKIDEDVEGEEAAALEAANKGIYKKENLNEKLFAGSIRMEKLSRTENRDLPQVNNPYVAMEEMIEKDRQTKQLAKLVNDLQIGENQQNGHTIPEGQPSPPESHFARPQNQEQTTNPSPPGEKPVLPDGQYLPPGPPRGPPAWHTSQTGGPPPSGPVPLPDRQTQVQQLPPSDYYHNRDLPPTGHPHNQHLPTSGYPPYRPPAPGGHSSILPSPQGNGYGPPPPPMKPVQPEPPRDRYNSPPVIFTHDPHPYADYQMDGPSRYQDGLVHDHQPPNGYLQSQPPYHRGGPMPPPGPPQFGLPGPRNYNAQYY